MGVDICQHGPKGYCPAAGGGTLDLGDTHPDLSAHPVLFYGFLCALLDSHHTPEGGRTLLLLLSGGSEVCGQGGKLEFCLSSLPRLHE